MGASKEIHFEVFLGMYVFYVSVGVQLTLIGFYEN